MRTLNNTPLSFLVLALSLAHSVSGAPHRCELSVVGSQFFEQFNWESANDPTHGRVNYLTLEQSRSRGLTYGLSGAVCIQSIDRLILRLATGNKFFMFPDSVNVVAPGSRGRDSNRISSKRAFDESAIILDVEHMPHGCATWPAFWTNSQRGPWPSGGEIDIIEGVHEAERDLISLHTLPGCSMPQERFQTGETVTTNCDVNIDFNRGCGTQVRTPGSYGEQFNSARGGFYALARSRAAGIRVWFWPRGNLTVPSDVLSGKDSVDPDLWGTPTANFPAGDNCNCEAHFDAHSIIFDLTFCGDWAGSPSVWSQSACSPMSCNDFVDQNPQAFQDAYWEINSLRVYTPW